jgi:hypothetical protein
MNETLHTRAQQLLAQDRVEGISAADRAWLTAHLGECAGCAASLQEMEEALRALRAAPVPLPKGLAARTQFRVRLRAQELRGSEPRHHLMWLTCGVSWALGVATAPYVWRVFESVGQHTGAPKILLQVSFGIWWAIPALVAGAAVLIENARQSRTTAWTSSTRDLS